MAPIRVALIGLSASATGTGWAASAHLPYLLKSPHYKVTALCNSSVDNAQKAIKSYDLPKETKAYGSPEDLAADPNVDLVVACVRVDSHAKVLLPSLKAGKDVFCEWPLDKNAKVAAEMLQAAKKGGGKAFLGLQARQSPIVKKVKQLVDSGRIGKVLSSTFLGATTNGGGEESTGVSYFTDRSVGGNMFSIAFGHAIDYILYTLGEPKTYSTILANQRPETKIIDRSAGNKVVDTVTKDTPDQVLFQSILTSGAVLSVHVRGGKPFPDKPQALWRIYGEKGEIEVTGPTLLLNVVTDGVSIKVHDQLTGELEEVQVETDGWEDLPIPARNIGRLYEAYQKGDKNGVVGFDEAVKRHVMLDDMYKAWDEGEQGRVADFASASVL